MRSYHFEQELLIRVRLYLLHPLLCMFSLNIKDCFQDWDLLLEESNQGIAECLTEVLLMASTLLLLYGFSFVYKDVEFIEHRVFDQAVYEWHFLFKVRIDEQNACN